MDNLVTFKTFSASAEAHLLKTRLEDEEIEVFLFDENIVNLNAMWDVLAGGIKLKIRESDIPRAMEIYNEILSVRATDIDGNPIECPSCGSTNITGRYKTLKSFKGLLVILLTLGLYPFWSDRVYKCSDCKKEFKA